jgi:hypothetical protein
MADQEETIEEVNDLLAKALEDANVYSSHNKVRPSALRAFDRIQEAHQTLTEIDPTRTADTEGDDA